MLRSGVLLLALALFGGCAAPGMVADAGEAPPDFGVEIVVRDRAVRRDGPYAPRRHVEHFVVFPDGTLHAEIGEIEATDLPRLSRILSPGELAGIWALCRNEGLDDPASGRLPVGSISPAAGSGAGAATMVALTANGRRWGYLQEQTPDPGTPLRRLVECVRDLAWIGTGTSPKPPPRRYDFGPDPYARYRDGS